MPEVLRDFPPGMIPETVPIGRQRMGQQTPVIYSPVFQRPLMAQYREFPYHIVPDTNPMVIPANGSVNSQFTIDGDNDYFLETLRAFIQTNSGLLFTIQLTDTRSGAQLFSAPAHINNIANPGTTSNAAGLPGYFSQLDWLISPAGSRATLAITLADLAGATNTVWLQLGGRRQLVNPGLPRTQLQ